MSGSADQARRLALVGLSRIVDPGHRGVHQAVKDHGAVEVWEALRRGAVCEPVSPELRAGASLRAEGYDPAADLDRLSRFGARLVCPGDAEWPAARLFWPQEPRLEAPPLALYVHGTHRLGEVVERSVAVVGARAATAYGAYVAGDLSTALCDRGVAVISGGAYGIDAAAHRGALASTRTPTIAVLACGVDVAYPRGHDRLLRQIASTGLVVSELPPGSSPTRGRFLIRTRGTGLEAALVVMTADAGPRFCELGGTPRERECLRRTQHALSASQCSRHKTSHLRFERYASKLSLRFLRGFGTSAARSVLTTRRLLAQGRPARVAGEQTERRSRRAPAPDSHWLAKRAYSTTLTHAFVEQLIPFGVD